jgi:hypothetical protein
MVDHGRKDPFVRVLVSPEHMELTTPIVGGSDLATRLTAEMWAPIFQQAVDRGEIRTGLDMAAVAEWIALVQFILVGRLDFAKADDPVHRKMLREFVLPAFAPVGAASAAQQAHA